MAPQSKASKRAGDEITESKPKKPRAYQRRTTTAADGKGGRQSKSTIKAEDSRLSPGPEVEEIERPEYFPKKLLRAENCFPRFNNGDVFITLGDKRKYNYQLHGSVLIRASTWFEKSLTNDDKPVELDEALALRLTSNTRVAARYEPRFTDDVSMGYLVRTSLTALKNPEILPTAVATPLRQSNQATIRTPQTTLPPARRIERVPGDLLQFDGHGSGTDELYEHRSTIILTGPQKTIKAGNGQCTTNPEPSLYATNIPSEPVVKEEVAQEAKLDTISVVSAEKLAVKTALEEGYDKKESAKEKEVGSNGLRGEAVKDEYIKEEDVTAEDLKQEEMRSKQVKSEAIKNEGIKDEYVKNEAATKEEEDKTEEVKGDAVKGDAVKGDAVKGDAVKDEDVKQEDAKDEDLQEGNIQMENGKRAATLPERLLDITTTPANPVMKEEDVQNLTANSEHQTEVDTAKSEPAVKEEEEVASILLSSSRVSEEPILPVVMTEVTIKHEGPETTVAIPLYQEIQPEPSQPIRDEQFMEGEQSLEAVRHQVEEKIKAWPEMLREAKTKETKEKKPAKLTPPGNEMTPATKVVRKGKHSSAKGDVVHPVPRVQPGAESAGPTIKKEEAVEEKGLQEVIPSVQRMEHTHEKSRIHDVQTVKVISNEEPNEIAAGPEVMDLTETRTTGQDVEMGGSKHEEQHNVATADYEQKIQPTIEQGASATEMEGVIHEKLAAGQKLSSDAHPIAPNLLISPTASTVAATTAATIAEDGYEIVIVSGLKTDARNERTQPAPTTMNEVTKEIEAPCPTPPKPAGPSEDLLEAYNNLFLIYYSQSPVIDTADIDVALQQIELFVQIAGIYSSLPIIRPHINSCLLSFGRELYQAIARDPPRWVKLSILIKSAAIFKEGIIHIVGTFPSWPSTSTTPEELGTDTSMLIENKISALETLKNGIDRRLFLSSIRVNGKEAFLDKNNQSTLSTWFVVQVWRDWHMRSISEAIHRGGNEKNGIATIYRAMARAGDAYLPLSYVVGLWEAFFHKEGSSYQATTKEIAEDLKLMKDFAQQAVQPLCVNVSMLNVEEANTGYFTCSKVENHELPWLEALALDESMA
ncbi:uncharacterized protein PAC_16044 [Phialocephala subalpina]|uniref:BTB domain-containing protein n=1 Tax=Phialocephala subalpina TaxID=576137 RepID=A0A1L7XM92_9HELO|nr:uncharacterized protein PAC_16044 [Phialocephala subalpina]